MAGNLRFLGIGSIHSLTLRDHAQYRNTQTDHHRLCFSIIIVLLVVYVLTGTLLLLEVREAK